MSLYVQVHAKSSYLYRRVQSVRVIGTDFGQVVLIRNHYGIILKRGKSQGNCRMVHIRKDIRDRNSVGEVLGRILLYEFVKIPVCIFRW